MDEGIWVEFLEFPWWLETALDRRFSNSITDVRLAFHNIIKTISNVLEALTKIALLLEEENGDEITSARKFVDNMIHLTTSMCDSNPVVCDSMFFAHLLEPFAGLVKQLCANFHPLMHLVLDDKIRNMEFEEYREDVKSEIAGLPIQCAGNKTIFSIID